MQEAKHINKYKSFQWKPVVLKPMFFNKYSKLSPSYCFSDVPNIENVMIKNSARLLIDFILPVK
jgi:hypothetical protein